MKKSTLLLLALAIVAGVLVYYLEFKPGKPRDEEPDTTREALKLNREDIQQITLTRNGQATVFEQKDNQWVITQPVSTPADESAISSLLGDVTALRSQRDIKATPDAAQTYGLNAPKIKLEFKLKNGQSHRIEFGDKDFSGSNVYARLDGASDIALVSGSLLTNADKELKDWRDRSVLGNVAEDAIKGLKLNTPAGAVALERNEADWRLTAPLAATADASEVNSLLTELTSAKAPDVVSETDADAGKYGLTASKLSATVQFKAGGERTLSIGNKIGEKENEQYYAKLSDRPQIFKIEKALFDKLNGVKLGTLRNKDILTLTQDQVSRVQLKNEHTALVIEPDKDNNKWLIREPADKKDKEASAFKFFTPLQSKASEIYDSAPAKAAAKLAKPLVTMSFTMKDGQTRTLQVSAAEGEDVYVRVDGKPTVYRVGKAFLDGLNFKLDDAVSN